MYFYYIYICIYTVARKTLRIDACDAKSLRELRRLRSGAYQIGASTLPARWMVCTSWLVLAGNGKRLEEWPCPTNPVLCQLAVCRRVLNCRHQPLSTCPRIDHRATTALLEPLLLLHSGIGALLDFWGRSPPRNEDSTIFVRIRTIQVDCFCPNLIFKIFKIRGGTLLPRHEYFSR